MTSQRWTIPVAIVVLALLAAGLAGAFLWNTTLPAAEQFASIVLFTGLMALAWYYPLPLSEKTKLYIDTTITIGAILHFQPGIAILIVGVGTLIGAALRREPFDEVVFNSAQVMLQAAAGASMLLLVGWEVSGSIALSLMTILAIIASVILVTLVNLVAVTIVVSLQTGAPARAIARQAMSGLTVLAQIVQVSLGVMAAILAEAAPWSVILLLAPSAAVYWVLHHNIILRQRLADRIRERELSLAEIERMAGFGSWEWHVHDETHAWSAAIYTLTGTCPDAVTPAEPVMLQFAHPADRRRVAAALEHAITSGVAVDLEHRIVRADGVERDVYTHAEVIRAADAPVRLVGTMQDVTERKHLERQLRQHQVQPLTAREVEVLDCLARGQSNKEIARELGITEQTIKNHVSAIMRKFRVNDRTQAVIVAVKEGWIHLDGSGGSEWHDSRSSPH